MERILYPDYAFGGGEYPPPAKFNDILKISEENRKQFGPYSISTLSATGAEWQPTASTYWLQLDEDPTGLGGIDLNNKVTELPETIRRFKVEYTKSATSGYLRFDDLQFQQKTIEGTSRWITQLTASSCKGGLLGNTVSKQIALSGLSISSFSCMKDWDGLPIWNGCVGAISFVHDDGFDVVSTGYAPIYSQFDVKCTAFVVPNAVGLPTYMSWNQIRSLQQSGHEIGSHGMDLAAMITGGEITYSAGDMNYLDISMFTHASGLAHLGYQIIDSQRVITHNLISGSNRTFSCDTFAYPKNARDGIIIDLVKQNYIAARCGERNTSIANTGIRGSDYMTPTWHHIESMWEIPQLFAKENWFNGGAYTMSQVSGIVSTGFSAPWTSLEYYSRSVSSGGAEIGLQNPWLIVSIHNLGDATPQQIQAALGTINARPEKWWVAPFGEVAKYWLRAQNRKRGND